MQNLLIASIGDLVAISLTVEEELLKGMPLWDDLLLIRSPVWELHERLWYINFCIIKIDSAIKRLKGCQVMYVWPRGNLMIVTLNVSFMARSFHLFSFHKYYGVEYLPCKGLITPSFATTIFFWSYICTVLSYRVVFWNWSWIWIHQTLLLTLEGVESRKVESPKQW